MAITICFKKCDRSKYFMNIHKHNYQSNKTSAAILVLIFYFHLVIIMFIIQSSLDSLIMIMFQIYFEIISNIHIKYIRKTMHNIFGKTHSMKSVRIRSSSSTFFPAFGLNTEWYSISLSIFSPNTEKFGPEKLWVWTLFTQ